jgi:U3 small nucleolar RNA-associated protein 3
VGAVSDSDESSEEEESEVEEVIGLTGAEENEDEDEDEEDDDEEEEEEDDDDDDSDEDEDDEDDDTDPHATKGWGVSKKNFYSGEEADSSDSEAEDGTGALEEEAAEARRLQRQRAQKLHADDFGDFSSDEETLGAAATRGSKNGKKDGHNAGLGGLEDEAEVEELSKDLSSMSREEKLQVLISDAPELVELLAGFKESVGQIRTQIAPLVQQVKDGKLPTSSGSSFLEVKFHLLLSYCINITFYLLLKARGETVQDHPVIETLVKLRALIEKCGPIDLKLKYQIEKLIAAAANPSGSGTDAALSHKPRPDALVGAGEEDDDGGEEDGGTGAAALYQVPKLSATRYDDGREESKFERKAASRRARLLQSDMVKSMQAELSDAPVEINAADPSRLRGEAAQAAKEAEERRVYEEDNFVRLTLNKKDKAKEKLRARAERGMLEDEFSSFDTEDFGELASLVGAEAEAEKQAAKRSEREQKKRRTLARYLNDIEQKERKVSKRGAASADSDLPWDAPEQKQPKRKKPDYDVHDDSDDEPKAPHVEDEVYTAAIEQRQSKKQQKKEKRERAAAEHAEAREMQEGKHEGGKRGATRDIIKNKGLTPHRNKLERNPRVKKKVKYAKKVTKARSSGLSGRQNTSVGGASGYAGESTGINAKVSRSTRIV